MSSQNLQPGTLEYYYYYYPNDTDNDGKPDYLEYYEHGNLSFYPVIVDETTLNNIKNDSTGTELSNAVENILSNLQNTNELVLDETNSLTKYITQNVNISKATVKLIQAGTDLTVEEKSIVYSPLKYDQTSNTQKTNKYTVFGITIEVTPTSSTEFEIKISNTTDLKYIISGNTQEQSTSPVTVEKFKTITFNHKNFAYSFFLHLSSATSWVSSNESTLNFSTCLYMTGKKLQAEAVEMFEIKDVVSNPFAIGNSDDFISEYESNPDILVEDMSEFLQAIDKLENLMKELSIDNNQRDQDTEFCCEGNPPPGGKPSC